MSPEDNEAPISSNEGPPPEAEDDSISANASWLYLPADGIVSPPVDTRAQVLPFNQLSWENFERLCLRLARRESDVEHCQLYGVRGQGQHGVDIYSRLKGQDNRYVLYQCKKVKDFGPAELRKAVQLFLSGRWAERACRLVVCTSHSGVRTQCAKEIEAQAAKLKGFGVELVPWDAEFLSFLLKSEAELVDDFFGRQWVISFLGDELAKSMGERLDRARVQEFRTRLGAFYGQVFSRQDPGLPRSWEDPIRPISDRYVLPDVLALEAQVLHLAPSELAPKVEAPSSPRFGRVRVVDDTPTYSREGIEKWLARNRKSVVLGGPGTGESALLRFLVSDLFASEPVLQRLAEEWGDLLPVWLPFAFWSKLISERGSCGIQDALQEWLRTWEEQELWPLVAQAIRDKRLLLVIDGIDEWSSEAAARVALQLLQRFSESQNPRIVVASRPHGFRRALVQTEGWQVGELAPLTDKQRFDVATKWFRIRATREPEAFTSRPTPEVSAAHDARQFNAELQHRPELDQLSRVPLLLVLLLYLKFQNAALPRKRFAAYQQLIDHWIRRHPISRRAASLVGESDSPVAPDPQELSDAFGFVAFRMHRDLQSGPISEVDLCAVLEDYLTDQQLGLGQPAGRARSLAQRFREMAEENLGLVVRQGQSALSFFHLSFQEFLAATHVFRLPIEEQKRLVREHAQSPSWREVILALMWLTKRPDDATKLIDEIRSLTATLDDLGLACKELLAEVAFGEFCCPPQIAREIAADTFAAICWHPWPKHQERLVGHVVEGLRAAPLRDDVATRLQKWLFRSRFVYRPSSFEAVSSWPSDGLTFELCRAGMKDEDPAVQRIAARVLGKVGRDEDRIRQLLVSVAKVSHGVNERAAALETCASTWPEDNGIDQSIEQALRSPSAVLRYAALSARIARGVRSSADRDELLRLASSTYSLPWEWHHSVSHLLVKGWSGDESVKRAALEARGSYDPDRMDRENAYTVLLNGFCNDSEVAEALACEIELEKHPFALMDRSNAWRALSSSFRNNERLIEAVDKWAGRLEASSLWVVELYYAAGIGRTPIQKRALMQVLNGSFPHWGVGGLLEHWGMDDPEVSGSLMEFANSSRVALSAHLLPSILPRAEARAKLLELLRDPDTPRPDFVASGLIAVTSHAEREETTNALLTRARVGTEHAVSAAVVETLIRWAPEDSRVRNLAMAAIDKEEDAPLGAIIGSYPHDDEIRKACASVLQSLPATLRLRLVNDIDAKMDRIDSMGFLRDYDKELDPEVMARAAVAYCRAAKGSAEYDRAGESLRGGMGAHGPYHDQQQQAALAGLMSVGRVDILATQNETMGEVGPVTVNMPTFSHEGRTLFSVIAESWQHLNERDRGTVLSCVHPDDRKRFWSSFAGAALAYPDLHSLVLEVIESTPEIRHTQESLRFLATVRSSSSFLREICLEVLRQEFGRTIFDGQVARVAAEVFAEQFSSEKSVLEAELGALPRWRPFERPGMIAALCIMDSACGAVRLLYEKLHSEDCPPVSVLAYYPLVYARVPSGDLVAAISRDASNANERGDRYSLTLIAEEVIRRLRRDGDARMELARKLDGMPANSEKASLVRLLAKAGALEDSTIAWARRELRTQLEAPLSSYGIDVVSADVRSVAVALLDALDGVSSI